MFLLNGGRGASSSSGGGGFGHAGNGVPKIEKLYPAEINLNVSKGNSVQAAVDRFKAKYGNAKTEYGVMLDKDGYALEHNKGQKHSVAFYTDAKDGTFVHNHPSGSNFSDTDLKTFANSKIKSVIAISSNATVKGDYQISKTDKFDARGFVAAMKSAKFDTSSLAAYNKGAGDWLKANQAKYGYTYTEKGNK